MLARIESIPTGMIVSADLKKTQGHKQVTQVYKTASHCESRAFAEFAGCVDLNVLGEKDKDNYTLAEAKEAHPICSFGQAPASDIEQLDLLMKV